MNVLPVNYCITLYKNMQSTLKMGQQGPRRHRYLSIKLLDSTCHKKAVFILVLLLVFLDDASGLVKSSDPTVV